MLLVRQRPAALPTCRMNHAADGNMTEALRVVLPENAGRFALAMQCRFQSVSKEAALMSHG